MGINWNKPVKEMTWQELYDGSVALAERAITRGQSVFICLVDKKYKQTIWNTAQKNVNEKREQGLLFREEMNDSLQTC